MTRWLAFWERMRGTYWVVPSAMAAAAAAVSFLTVNLDRRLTAEVMSELSWVYTGGPEGARQVLSTVAATMITVAGVTFSITIVALTLASQQFGPRLLRNFLQDVGNQVTLGTFISTYIYCLLVLRTVRGSDDLTFVPHLAVTVGVLMAIVSVGVLIFFIHHVAVSIQATQVIANVARDLERAIVRLYPEEIGHESEGDGPTPPVAAPSFDGEHVVTSPAHGYVQAIESERLLAIAGEDDLVVRVEARPGRFVRRGAALLSVVAAPGGNAGGADDRLRATFLIGSERNGTQDVWFFIEQLVELAVRALSPGINDPATARACIDRLSAALFVFAGRRMPSAERCDEAGRVRVVAPPVSFATTLDVAFTEIARYGRTSVSVTCRLLDAICELAAAVRRESDRLALVRQASRIVERAGSDSISEGDRLVIMDRYAAAMAALDAGGPPAR